MAIKPYISSIKLDDRNATSKTTATRNRKYMISSNWTSAQIHCGDPNVNGEGKIECLSMLNINDLWINRSSAEQRIKVSLDADPFIIWLQRKNPLHLALRKCALFFFFFLISCRLCLCSCAFAYEAELLVDRRRTIDFLSIASRSLALLLSLSPRSHSE